MKRIKDPEAGRALADYIDRRLGLLGMTRADLYKKSGVNRHTVQPWLAGWWAPTAGPGERMASVLGVTYGDMYETYRTRGQRQSPLDPAVLIAAFEWAIARVREAASADEEARVRAEAEAELSQRSERRPRSGSSMPREHLRS